MTSTERVGPKQPGTDDLLDALASATRRRLLLELLERDRGANDGLAVDDFADALADDTGTWRSRIDLQHRHLPKLERLGLVRWDRVDAVVTRGPAFAEVNRFWPSCASIRTASPTTGPERRCRCRTSITRAHPRGSGGSGPVVSPGRFGSNSAAASSTIRLSRDRSRRTPLTGESNECGRHPRGGSRRVQRGWAKRTRHLPVSGTDTSSLCD
jgi:hypothetical protein